MRVVIFTQFTISKEVACEPNRVGQTEFCWYVKAHLWEEQLKLDDVKDGFGVDNGYI